MKHLHLFIRLTGSILILLLPKQLVNACAFYVSPGEYRFWLLQPDLTNEQDLTPFFFAATYLYKQGENGGKETYPKRNIDEWMEQVHRLGKQGSAPVKREDVDTLLNYTAPIHVLEKPDSLATSNSFVRLLLRKDNGEWLQYIRLSKKVEQIAGNPDPWEEGPAPNINVTRVIQEAKTLYRQTTSPFIKYRTAYQLMRLYGFNGNQADLCRIYDDRIAPITTSSWIHSAALYLKAIRGGQPQYDLLLAQVFDRGDYNRSYCLTRLRSANVDSLIRTSSDKHLCTVLRAMKTFNYPGRALDDIEKIDAAEPAYCEIPFLLLREINKVEDWLVTNKVTGFRPAVYNATYDWELEEDEAHPVKINRAADLAYAIQLNKFLLRLIREKNTGQPALLHLYAAHLSMLTGDYAAARQQLTAAATYKNLPANVRSQIAINHFLLQLETQQRMDAPMEKTLLGLLREPASHSGFYDADKMKDQLILYTARKMISNGDKAKGLLLLSRTKRALGDLPISAYKDVYQEITENASPTDYDSIIAVLGRKDKTPFEKFVTTGKFGSPLQYWEGEDSTDQLFWDRNRLLDGKAAWYLRNYQLELALQTLRLIPDQFWRKAPYKDYTGGNPFYLDIYNHGQYYGKRKISYNKRTIVERMLQLDSLALNNPSRRAECYFQLANAWYNMSWYGNNWLMVKSWWAGGELAGYAPAIKRTSFNDFYYGCSRALQFYLRAMQETHDKRLVTLCCFMAGECNDNQKDYFSQISFWSGHPQSKSGSGNNPYIRNLKQKGVDEDLYQHLVEECATYKDYIRTFDKAL